MNLLKKPWMTFVNRDKLVLLLFLLVSTISVSAQPKRILWIGNSYTYVNNLPEMFRLFALSAGDTVIVDSSAPGGYTFLAHTNNATTLQKIAQPGWDYVVIQAQSQEPSFPPNQVLSQTLPYAAELDSLIHVANPCAQTVYYMTWGRKYGDAANCGNYPPLCTFDGMTNRLRWGYKTMADATESLIAPAGIAWRNAWYADSTINLWSADFSHPAVAGTYLTAATFYSTIFNKPTENLSYTGGLDATTAGFLRATAASTYNDSSEVWNANRWNPSSAFSYTVAGNSISFMQEALHADAYLWDFGDGSTSDLPVVTHEFAAGSSYTVQLIASNGCQSDTSSQEIVVDVLATENRDEASSWRIYPNPALNEVMIQSIEPDQFHITVYTAEGKLHTSFDERGPLIRLNFSTFPSGIYQVVCTSGGEQRIFRIMKD